METLKRLLEVLLARPQLEKVAVVVHETPPTIIGRYDPQDPPR